MQYSENMSPQSGKSRVTKKSWDFNWDSFCWYCLESFTSRLVGDRSATAALILFFPITRSHPNIGKEYSRVRIGIGKPENNIEVADYVLQNFDEDENIIIEKISKDITDSISILVEKKLDLFSSTVNNKKWVSNVE